MPVVFSCVRGFSVIEPRSAAVHEASSSAPFGSSTAKSEPCNFGMVYSTDGRIKNLDLTVLEDDRKFFLPYSGCVVVSTKLYEQAPEIAELMAPVSAKLTDSVMQELNGRIDIDGEDPADVAYDWLQAEGFIA